VLAAGGGSAYLWKPGLQTSPTLTVKPPITTTYTLVASNGSCSDSATITIVAPCTSQPCGALFVPDAFSPNADGQNDMLYVRFNPACVQYVDFEIFDRWGNKVFEGNSINEGWDGRYHGQPMNSGTYVYYLHLTDRYNNNYSRKGSITLVR
jgi:gliding motility-associated-like protein